MKKFDVMFSVDSKYIDVMLGSIYSFLVNSKIDNVRIHVIASNFSLEDYKIVESITNMFSNVELYFYPFDDFDIEKYNIPSWRGVQISNARLFFEEILRPDLLGLKNLLYLDSDTITLSDLTGLEHYSDGLFLSKDASCLKHRCKSMDLDNYFNSGVIYINVDEWLENDYQGKIIKFLENNDSKLDFPDQDVLNLSLSENIKELPVGYNIPPHVYLFNDFFSKLYFNSKYRNVSYEEVVAAKTDPKIIHSYGFSGIKPWHGDFNPFHDEYMQYILKVNPNFEADKLDGMKKIVSKFPHLYSSMLLMRTYLPERAERTVKKLALKCQQGSNVQK